MVLTKLLEPPYPRAPHVSRQSGSLNPERTLRPQNRSGYVLSVTEVTVPLGSTSSNALKLSMVNPNWFVFHEYPRRHVM